MTGSSWETIVTWCATVGPEGGWYGSKPQESEVSDEADYPQASMRARIESLLPGVHDAQVIQDGRSIETWVNGELLRPQALPAGANTDRHHPA